MGTLSKTSFLLLPFALVLGCAGKDGILHVDRYADIPEGAIPDPAGQKSSIIQNSQIKAASIDQQVLYHADFIGSTTDLAPAADRRISLLTASDNLMSTLIIEPSDDTDLDNRRVAAMKSYLDSREIVGVTIELAYPAALGLESVQAEAGLGPSSGRFGGLGSASGQQTPVSFRRAR